jgi:DNA-binding NarL/FixJ family response regulator
MIKRSQLKALNGHTQVDKAMDRLETVEERIENARTREELAETRTELAETRTELAEVRTAIAESRAEQAEATLQKLAEQGGADCDREPGSHEERTRPLARLTDRQREILQYIAEGQNTKQIAATLDLSPKTVEYHRSKLMEAVHVYDVPGLVRLAVRAGLVPSDA